MKKILLFSFFLMLGLVVSQFLPAMVGEGYSSVKTVSNTLLYVCLAFIMINVGPVLFQECKSFFEFFSTFLRVYA